MDTLSAFDRPVFKVLPVNDSGQSKGNQSGILIPEALDAYFPQLSTDLTAENPTSDETITAILIAEGKHIETVETRYQYQTRAGERGIERRITGNLGEWHKKSVEGDMVLIERNLADRTLYRLTLIKKGSDDFKKIQAASSGKKWGPANPLEPPVTEQELKDAESQQKAHEAAPLRNLFDNDAATTESRTKRIARSRAFQKSVSEFYAGKCAVCGLGFIDISDRGEVEAAHIVPRGKKGADDARNGLALCRSHHWAFDRGLWAINGKGEIEVAPKAAGKGSNDLLKGFAGKKLAQPNPSSMAPVKEAFEWHMKEVFNR